ncbi:MAG: hypothetical protein RML74_02480 [Acidobacteriota bacterium]|nr:hypothetical protein [Acidobacteriota bacterium]
MDAEDSKTIYVAGWQVLAERGGGIYRSRDGGRTWALLPGTEGHSVRALAQAPSDPRVLIFTALDGVFRSEDRGESWRRISPAEDPEIRNVESVAIDPRSDRTLYVGTWHLPWKTTDGGRTWTRAGSRETGIIDDSEVFNILIDERDPNLLWLSACTGVYRSTDGGRSWRRMTGLPSRSRRVLALAKLAGQRDVLFAGTTEGLWRTGDGGATWRLITNRRLTVQDIALHPQRPSRVLIATEEGGVWLSQDGGMTFRPANRGFSSWVITDVLPDREIPERIYCGVLKGGLEGGFFLSEDGGQSWRVRPLGGVKAILQSRRDGRRLFVVTDGGIFFSEDRGESWRKGPSLAESVLQIAEASDGKLLALTSKALLRYEESRGRWELIRAVEGQSLAALHVGRRIWLVGEGRLWVSEDGGSWAERALPDRMGRVHVILEHPSDSDLLFIGTSFGLYRSRDGGRSWERCAHGLPHADVAAIAVHPRDPRWMLITDYRTGAVYLSSDRGETWRRIDGAVGARAWGGAFDPHDGERIFVGSRGMGIYVGRRSVQLVERENSP